MMINTPSAPGGAAAAPNALPGVALGDAAFAATPAQAEGTAESGGLPALFAQMLDFASLAAPAGTPAAAANGGQPADEAADTGADLETDAGMPLAAMMTTLPFALLPGARTQVAPAGSAITATGTLLAGADRGQARGASLLGTAADAIAASAAATSVTATPLAARLLQGALPAAGDTPALRPDARQSAASTAGGTATPSGTAVAATVLAAQDGAAQPGSDGQSGQPHGDGQASFRGVMAAAAPAAGAGAPADTVKLVGNPDQWQQPLRAALGDRLQVTLQKGNDQAVNQAVIRLEPPNLGSIEISIRQSAGALHVSLSATNSEVVRQLNAVGDSMRQDLSQRQQGDVAVTVSQASSRSLADSEGRGRQPEREAEQQREQRGPGRALNEGDDTNTTFAMLRE